MHEAKSKTTLFLRSDGTQEVIVMSKSTARRGQCIAGTVDWSGHAGWRDARSQTIDSRSMRTTVSN